MVQLQSEDNYKKAVGKADNNKKQATKEQTVNEKMILNKDANLENNKSEREVKREGEQYGKPNQQYHQKVIADETKTKEKEKKTRR